MIECRNSEILKEVVLYYQQVSTHRGPCFWYLVLPDCLQWLQFEKIYIYSLFHEILSVFSMCYSSCVLKNSSIITYILYTGMIFQLIMQEECAFVKNKASHAQTVSITYISSIVLWLMELYKRKVFIHLPSEQFTLQAEFIFLALSNFLISMCYNAINASADEAYWKQFIS